MTESKCIKPCNKNDLFDIGCQICDDVKNDVFKNGFIIYYNNGNFMMASSFRDAKIIPHSIEDTTSRMKKYFETITTTIKER
jgi:hypothetical protein